MKTLIVGASEKPDRYAYKAIKLLTSLDHDVLALGNREGKVDDTKFIVGKPDLSDIHTVTLYINPKIQEGYIDYLLGLRPERIIFNPGTENTEFYKKAIDQGIEAINACTLVMLRTGQYA